jgi:hypothetical protein
MSNLLIEGLSENGILISDPFAANASAVVKVIVAYA